jgi:ATPase subunit of ABC transporter with duplicated ATPase domains
LELQKHARVGVGAQEQQADPMKVALEAIKNNEHCIRRLEKDLKNLSERRDDLAGGLESKLNGRKHELEKRLGDLRGELKRMRL